MFFEWKRCRIFVYTTVGVHALRILLRERERTSEKKLSLLMCACTHKCASPFPLPPLCFCLSVCLSLPTIFRPFSCTRGLTAIVIVGNWILNQHARYIIVDNELAMRTTANWPILFGSFAYSRVTIRQLLIPAKLTVLFSRMENKKHDHFFSRYCFNKATRFDNSSSPGALSVYFGSRELELSKTSNSERRAYVFYRLLISNLRVRKRTFNESSVH